MTAPRALQRFGALPRHDPERVVGYILLLARLLTLVLIGAFASVAGHLGLLTFSDFQPWWLLIIAVAAAFSALHFFVIERYAVLVPLAEAATAVAIVIAAGPEGWPLVIYLVMAPVFVGIAGTGWMPILVAGAEFGTLLVLRFLDSSPWEGLPPEMLVRLGLIGLLFGSATALVRHAADRILKPPSRYAQALSLLEQLSEVTRELPAGLRIDAVASDAQATLQEGLHASEVALFRQQCGQWALQCGPDTAASLVSVPGFGEDLRPGLQPLREGLAEAVAAWSRTGTVRILPLRAPGRHPALALVRFDGRPPNYLTQETVRKLAEDAAAQIAAAEVYAEVTARATAEERRRVSREIHDGVAQDLAALTYRLDNIAADTGLEPVGEAAEEVRRLVRELRLSIFDLRTDVGVHEALGTTIGDYAQHVAHTTGVVVHTTVSEHGPPLDAHIQHELLRICQEAVANARRHARARNMWITYKNYGAGWLLRVADDGIGVIDSSGPRGLSGEGMSIMRERVNRIGGTIVVRRRIGGGTVVEVVFERGARRPASRAGELEKLAVPA